MSDDDKTPVDTKCGAQIRDRSGRDLGYVCNLTRGHLGRHAEVALSGGGIECGTMDDSPELCGIFFCNKAVGHSGPHVHGMRIELKDSDAK